MVGSPWQAKVTMHATQERAEEPRSPAPKVTMHATQVTKHARATPQLHEIGMNTFRGTPFGLCFT